MTLKQLFAGIFVASLLVGCGSGTQELDQDYMKQSQANAQVAKSIYDKYEGKWESVTPEDKKKITDAYGSEAAALKVWDSIAHPMIGGAPAPPPSK